MLNRRGRHFLQIPGPTNVPDRILRAMDRPTIVPYRKGGIMAAMTYLMKTSNLAMKK